MRLSPRRNVIYGPKTELTVGGIDTEKSVALIH